MPVALVVGLSGCTKDIGKLQAIDVELLERSPLPADFVKEEKKGQFVVSPDIAWMGKIGIDDIAFVGLRADEGQIVWCFVVNCDPSKDTMVLMRLEDGVNPLDLLANAEAIANVQKRAREAASSDKETGDLMRYSITELISGKVLGCPLPQPAHIYAVAANFPSHLEHDLARGDIEKKRPILEASRARVFLKWPPSNPPHMDSPEDKNDFKILGPFDEICYPDKLLLPADAEGRPGVRRELLLDYEIEIGVVFGKRLTAENIGSFSDADIRKAILGYVLINDTKARNPQVMKKVVTVDMEPQADNPYRMKHKKIDRAITIWNETSCQWWSYAASCGSFTTVGPFLVGSRGSKHFESRSVLSARSYASPHKRAYPVPRDHSENTLYLRQCSVAGVEEGLSDRMIHDVPAVVRSIVSGNNALSFMDGAPTIEVGDIVCMGTPGGTALTSKPYVVFDTAEDVLFWKEPLFWHDAFFKGKSGEYLHDNDKLFLWAEGLGFQFMPIKRMDSRSAD